MRGSKLFWISLCFFVFCLADISWAMDKTAICLEQGKKFFAEKKYQQAKTSFLSCVDQNPSSIDALLSLAGAQLTLDELDSAEKTFQDALKKMGKNSPYISYTYSMLGDIALKKQKNEEALQFYTKSLESNAANVNSLVGKGVIIEYQGDRDEAAEFYRTALAVEPLNLVARQRLINLEPDYLTDAEMLLALKQRYAIAPDAKELTEEDRQLFRDIHSVEQRKGVEYLKNKYPRVPSNYIVTLNKGTEFERDILTLEGYKALSKSIGQDAVAVFQQIGVPTQSVFFLRNMRGEKIFNEDSTLTKSGFYVYTEALQNRKAFLLPEEAVPPTAEKMAKVKQYMEDLKKRGYVQMSSTEKKKLEKETKCSETVLKRDLGLVIVPLTKRRHYYFATPNDPKDAKKSVSYYYTMLFRSKKNPSVQVPTNSMVEGLKFYNYTVCLDDGELL